MSDTVIREKFQRVALSILSVILAYSQGSRKVDEQYKSSAVSSDGTIGSSVFF